MSSFGGVDEYVVRLMKFYFGDKAEAICSSFHLIPLMYSENVVRQVMNQVLSNRSSSFFLTECRLSDIVIAYDQVMQSFAEPSTEDICIDRQAELGIYVQATRRILSKCDWSMDNLESIGEDLFASLSYLRSLTGDELIFLTAEPYRRVDPRPQIPEVLPTRNMKRFSQDKRSVVIPYAGLTDEKVLTDVDLKALEYDSRLAEKAYVELSPEYLMRQLAFSNVSVVDVARSFCSRVRGTKDFERDDVEDAVMYYGRLSVKTLNYIYLLCNGTYRSAEKWFTDYVCYLCTANHSADHCMRNLTREMRLRKIQELQLCFQCGNNQDVCQTFNRHSENEFNCSSCRSVDQIHKQHQIKMCNCPVRWSKGSDSVDHDLYLYCRDMTLVARATLHWKDEDWSRVFKETSLSYLRNWRDRQIPARFIQSTKDKRNVGDQRFCPQNLKLQYYGKQFLLTPMRENSDEKMTRVSKSYQSSSSQDLIDIPLEYLAIKQLFSEHRYDAVAVFAFFLNAKFRKRLLVDADQSSDKVLQSLRNMVKRLHSIHLKNRTIDDMSEVHRKLNHTKGRNELWLEFKSLSEETPSLTRKAHDVEEGKDVYPFMNDLLEYLDNNCSVDATNPSTLFHNTVSDIISDIPGHLVTSGAYTMNSFDVTSSSESDLNLLIDQCFYNNNSNSPLRLVNEVADILVLRVKRFADHEGNDKCIKIHSNVGVISRHGIRKRITLQTVLCDDAEEANLAYTNANVAMHRRWNGQWYRFTGRTVEKVDEIIAEKYCGKHGFIFIFDRDRE